MMHQDVSKALAAEGVDVTLISAGQFKVEGNPYQPLGKEAKQFMQSRIDDYYGAFTRGVARGRGVAVNDVRDNMGKGRVYGASQALAANMVDGVMPFGSVISKMQTTRTPRAATATMHRQVRMLDAETGIFTKRRTLEEMQREIDILGA